MGRISETRVLTLERQTVNLNERLETLESQFVATTVLVSGPGAPMPPDQRVPVAAGPARAASAAAAPREKFDFEDLLGGRVLAWTGAIAFVAGIAFLLAIAVSRGWIGPSERTLLAGALSATMIGAGIWLYEHRQRTDAALAALSAGVAGMFTTVGVGAPVYDVLPVAAALALALATGALATVYAVRWQSRAIGALGIVGALLAPILAGAPSTSTTLALLWLAAASGAAVLVWQRWNWLALAVFAVSLPQLVHWLADSDPSTPAILFALCAFGAVYVAAAIGFELRVPAAKLRPPSALLLTVNALALALAGWFALDAAGATGAGRAWIGTMAVAHIAVGLATRSTRINRDVRLLALVLGVVLADVTAGLLLEGVLLAAVLAATTTGFGLLTRRVLAAGDPDNADRDGALLGLGLGGHLLLTCIQTFTQAPPETVIAGDPIAWGGYAAVAVTICAAFVAGRFVDEVRRQWRVVLDAVAMTGAAYLTTVALDGALLVAAFAAEAVALGVIAKRGRDSVAAWGGVSYLTLALGYGLFIQAPPDALVVGLGDVPGTVLALGSAAAAALCGARLLAGTPPRAGAPAAERELHGHALATLSATGAIALLYLASTVLVTAFAPGDGAPSAGILDLGVPQLGQLLLSALWALTGVVALVVGLRGDARALRLGALALLLVTVGKVFLYDLATLTSLYRVGSFIGLGLLLLVAAGIWQKLRPRPLPDLRELPDVVR